MKKKFLFFIIVVISSLQYVNAQKQFTGTVTDANTNKPLVGASIVLQGTSNGTNTNTEGKFNGSIYYNV